MEDATGPNPAAKKACGFESHPGHHETLVLYNNQLKTRRKTIWNLMQAGPNR